MESKLNHEAIEAYASTYTKRIIADFFIQHDKITGQQIVDLKGVKQVNLMVLKNLFQKWKKESDKWQSPYFNYENAEVKKALQAFMNTLSLLFAPRCSIDFSLPCYWPPDFRVGVPE